MRSTSPRSRRRPTVSWPTKGCSRTTPSASSPPGGSAMTELAFLQAISRGLWEEMEADKTVFLMGEDIGKYGGAFRVTEGFLDKFGPERVIETPLAEEGFVGAAIGAAYVGMRPVVEFQFID